MSLQCHFSYLNKINLNEHRQRNLLVQYFFNFLCYHRDHCSINITAIELQGTLDLTCMLSCFR